MEKQFISHSGKRNYDISNKDLTQKDREILIRELLEQKKKENKYLLDSYWQRPKRTDLKRKIQDICFSISTVQSMWYDPIVDEQKYSIILERDSLQALEITKENLNFDPIYYKQLYKTKSNKKNDKVSYHHTFISSII